MRVAYVVVASDPDPVAASVCSEWGTPPSIGEFVDGVPLRRLGPSSLLLKRPGPHIHDERLDARLPVKLRDEHTPLVFPSIHRSERGIRAITVHPLGNPGPSADFGGEPRTFVPTAPKLMTDTLRAIVEEDRASGLPVSFEATHHGPQLSLPAFFVEIGGPEGTEPPSPPAVKVLAKLLPRLSTAPGDRVAVGVGGGHYAPHFTDLALRRRWAFGHILSRHAIESVDPEGVNAAYRSTPTAEGFLFARAEDARREIWSSVGPRLRDAGAPERTRISFEDSAAPRSP